MHKLIAALFLVLFAQTASAEACPDKYRFVDFGLKDSQGVLRRGGTIFRAFDTKNRHLLLRDSVICHAVEENAKDGRALKIPVVSRIEIDLSIAALGFTRLQMLASDDLTAVAESNAIPHRDTLSSADVTKVQGASYLCASSANSGVISCQVQTPYAPTVPLVIYCDAARCQMPVLGFNAKVIIDAEWKRTAIDAHTLGSEIMEKLQELQDFLKPHT